MKRYTAALKTLLALSILLILLTTSCEVGTSYMLRKMTLEGIVPSSRIRVVPSNEEPHISAGARLDLTTIGHVQGIEHPYFAHWIADSTDHMAVYRTTEPNVYWTRPEATLGVSIDGYLLRWLAPFVDMQMTSFGGDLLPAVSGGVGFILRSEKLSGRLDGSLKLTRMRYNALFVDDEGVEPDITRSGTDYARGFAIQGTFNTMKDLLFLKYYLSAGYELMDFTDEIEGELLGTSLKQAYAGTGVFHEFGPVTAIAGIRFVMLTSSMLDLDPYEYLEPNFQLYGNINLPFLEG